MPAALSRTHMPALYEPSHKTEVTCAVNVSVPRRSVSVFVSFSESTAESAAFVSTLLPFTERI